MTFPTANCQPPIAYFLLLHLSLQYFTSSQTFSHFFLHVNGLLQIMQIFWGRFSFFICLPKVYFLDFLFCNVKTCKKFFSYFVVMVSFFRSHFIERVHQHSQPRVFLKKTSMYIHKPPK